MLVSAIHQHESVIRTPMSPPSWTSLPPPTPLGCHRALGLSSQHHIANSHWLFCFMCGKVYGLEKENGNPLQYSCLENPVDRGAWWAGVHRVAQSRKGLKWLSMHARVGEGNGNPFQYSCLENPRDPGAWWAAVYGVAQGQTQLKRCSSSSSRLQVPWE